MYIVVSKNSNRIPSDLEGFQIEQWSGEEFLNRASADDGINVDEGIWYDTDCLTEEVYSGLTDYKAAGVNIVYYRFSNTPEVTFHMDDEVKVYNVDPPKVEKEPIQESTPQPSPEPVAQPAPQSVEPQVEPKVEEPPVVNQMQQQSTPQMQVDMSMQYNQPQPMVSQPQVANNQQIVTPAQVAQPVPQMQYQSSISPIQSNLNVAGSSGMMTSNMEPTNVMDSHINKTMYNMLQYDDYDSSKPQENRKAAPAKVILSGSSKGGTGKTFTCLMGAYWYAKSHPTERIAVADFDIIDGQIGITINKLTPTMNDFYKLYKAGNSDFEYLDNCKVKSSHFSPNIDFYLAPSQDIPEVTNDTEYWTQVFKLLITNYDVVFFDSGIDYLGKKPISQLYKIADKIIITCNPSINSVKSVIKQFKTLSGKRANNVFKAGDNILSRVNVVLTRVDDNNDVINNMVVQNITTFAPVIAAFGNIDGIISPVQWYQQWELIDANPDITSSLEDITTIE